MPRPLKLVLVAGARPNFVKIAPLLAGLRRAGHQAVQVHTGQHYDAMMSEAHFADLGLPAPDVHLGVGPGSPARQTARIMEGLEPVLRERRPHWVVVVGDVTSTLAAALVAAQLRPELGCRLAHVEAGLRSGDRDMPEEMNRVLTDRLSDLLLTPTRDADAHLSSEGFPTERVTFVGNVMIDALLVHLPAARERNLARSLGLERERFALATLHRAANVDHPDRLALLLDGLGDVATTMPVVLPLHPRTRHRIESFGLEEHLSPFRLLEPLGYLGMLSLTDAAAVCLTDSGGLQQETAVLGVPCVTLRDRTEWVVAVECGANRLVPEPLSREAVMTAFDGAWQAGRVPLGSRSPEGWDGRAAGRIVAALEAHVAEG